MLMIVGAITPFVMAAAIQGIMAFTIVWLFCRYDVLTMIISLMVYVMIPEVAGLFCTGSASHIQNGIIILGGGVAVYLGALILLFRKNALHDFEEITPIFAKHISERQRMQQELEIAYRANELFTKMRSVPSSNSIFVHAAYRPWKSAVIIMIS